ncbi:MAG: zf-HC2 domain-containing protein [Gemmatimonadota bacterium]|nr:MAG: zf-HC2 domain-containing protein [Gemmatimonadota bacterium]
MSCEKFKNLMMGYIDDELNEHDRGAFLGHVRSCAECSSELEHYRKLKEVTDGMKLTSPEDKIWRDYWSVIYNRIERGVGWILLSICGILLLCYGGYKAVEEFIADPTVGLFVKVAILGLIVGVAILFISVLRERLYFWKRDRYRDVRR